MPIKDKVEKARYDKKYWGIPENKERRRKRAYQRYRLRRQECAAQRHASEIRKAMLLVGVQPSRINSLGDLYDAMVEAVKENLVEARRIILGGIPDAPILKTEFKVGFDRLHSHQLIWNVINGLDCRIRWAPSYDDLEIALQGGANNTRSFESYKDFIVWKYGLEEKQCLGQ